MFALITVIAGGTGSIKLVRGLASLTKNITIISNVGDNIWLYGLYVCPDIDTVLYGLANLLDGQRGWGIKNDSFGFLHQLGLMGEDVWFKLGDKDLATHIVRTNMLKNGLNLSEITEWLRKKYAISARVIPATDDVVETNIVTKEGEMHLQEYWVRNRAQPAVIGIKYKGANRATVNPRVITALKRSKTIIVAPANPITSIGPILAIRGMKKLLATQKHKVVAISPIVGDSAVSGPATKYMTALRIENSPYGVAKYYSKFIDRFVISKSDDLISQKIRSLNLKVYETDIIMKNNEAEKRLASYLLNLPKNV